MRKLWILGLGMLGWSASAGEPATLLAIGDSITQGGEGFPSYRQFLVPELRKRGLAIEFIGPEEDAHSRHAGYGGRNTAWLLEKSKEFYRKYPADFVLIHSGHNSFSKDRPVPGIVRDTAAMIGVFREINPRVTVMLAQVIPSGKLPKYSYIPELNRELGRLATLLHEEDSKVILVDQADGFDWRTDTLADKVHPNAEGAAKMAMKWLEALLPLLKPPDGGATERGGHPVQ